MRRVDVLRGRLEIVEAMTEVNGRAVFGPPKTHQGRSVPVPAFLRDELAPHVAGKPGDAFVFPAPRGGVLRVGELPPRRFERGGAAVGSTTSCRTSCATRPLRWRSHRARASRACRRCSATRRATVTLDRYGHLFGDELDAVAERIDAARTADFSRTPRGRGVGRARALEAV